MKSGEALEGCAGKCFLYLLYTYGKFQKTVKDNGGK